MLRVESRHVLLAVALLVTGCTSARINARTATTDSENALAVVTTTSAVTTTTVAPMTAAPSPPSTAFTVIGRPIPWLDQQSARNLRILFAHTLPTSAKNAAPCTLDSLHVEANQGGAMGDDYGTLWVHNISALACQVQGIPDVTLLAKNGGAVSRTDPALLGTSTSQAIVLAPDSWAEAWLGGIASNVCGGSESSTLRFNLGDQTATFDFAVGRPIDTNGCPDWRPSTAVMNLQVDSFMAIPEPPNGDYLLNPIRGLTAQLKVPATVRPGEVLRYSVLLINPAPPKMQGGYQMGALVTSEDCPVYRESLGDISGQYLLNCAAAGDVMITGQGAIRFEMELVIPASMPTGQATLTWETTEPTGVSATATVTVTS